MNPRSTLILAGVAALLAAFVYFYEIRGADERAEAEDAVDAVFLGVSAQDISAFELPAEGGRPIRLERSEGAWQVVAPVQFPADSLNADGIASGLAELQAERVFEEHEPLEAYGLDGEPRVRFWVGSDAYALHVGNAAPVGSETYVTDASGDRVFAVPTFKTTSFTRTLDELREKRVLDFDRADVTGLEVHFGGERIAVEKRDGSWRLTAPSPGAADQDTVDGLLSDLAFLRAVSFYDDEPDLAGLGLDAPWYRVLVQTGSDESVTLLVGSENEAGNRIAQGRAGPRYWVDGSGFLDWPRTLTAFRDRQVARFASVDAESFALSFRGADAGESTVVSAVRSDQGWSVTPEPMAPGKASGILAELSNLKAADIVADELGPEELSALGLEPPRVAIEVRGNDAALAAVHLGALQPGRGVPSRRAAGGPVFWLDESVAETLPLDLDAYRSEFAAEEDDGAAGEPARAGDGAADEPAQAGDGAADEPAADVPGADDAAATD